MGIWVFLHALLTYNYFCMFGLLSMGVAIWMAMGVYCLQCAMAYEKEINWTPDTPFAKRLGNIIILSLLIFIGLSLLRVELHNPTMWKF